MKNLLTIKASDGLCNCRIKFYPDRDGNWYPVQKMTSEKKIFNPKGYEKHGYSISAKTAPQDTEELYCCALLQDDVCTDGRGSDRARLRARSQILDIIRCNLDFEYFCTLTYDSQRVDREDYNEVVKKFSQWADNRVRRKELKYLAVIERHKASNGLHFHVLCNSVLDFVESGTVKCPNHKKPIRVQTADRYGIPAEDRKIVYNITDWCYGFSTAIEITADPLLERVGNYLRKYMTKDTDKIGGRWYYSGGALVRPRYEFCNDDFYACDTTYEIAVPGNVLRVFVP